MKIPKEIIGKNKLRDLDICRLYIGGLSPEEIKTKRTLNIDIRRIQKIISDNAAFVNPRIAWPKSKRVYRLQKLAEKYAGVLSKNRDEIDILEQLRKEVEGDKPAVAITQQIQITSIHTVATEYQEHDIESIKSARRICVD